MKFGTSSAFELERTLIFSIPGMSCWMRAVIAASRTGSSLPERKSDLISAMRALRSFGWTGMPKPNGTRS